MCSVRDLYELIKTYISLVICNNRFTINKFLHYEAGSGCVCAAKCKYMK